MVGSTSYQHDYKLETLRHLLTFVDVNLLRVTVSQKQSCLFTFTAVSQ